MDEFSVCLKRSSGAEAGERLLLEFRAREKTRQRAALESGEAIGIRLPRGTVLRGGDLIATPAGRVALVVAAPEAVANVCTNDPAALARAAYHLGNRHVRLQVGPNWVRYLADHVLDAMVRGLGLEPVAAIEPFEPEHGAYHSVEHAHGAHEHDRHSHEGHDGLHAH